jgi:ubiquinone biosynthesis protein
MAKDKSAFSLRNVQRLAVIVKTFAAHGFWSFIESINVKHILRPDEIKRYGKDGDEQFLMLAETAPKRLRAAFEELGPAFVKLGQLLASREDLVPESFASELRKLHSDVKKIPYSEIESILQYELGDLSEFAEISATPLAAGSIGQVHRARLKDGRDVIIKVRRPHIVEQIATDVELMRYLTVLLERTFSDFKELQVQTIVEEFAWAIKGELDFIREAANMCKVAEHFRDRKDIVIPEVYWNLSTSHVLTQSFIDGYRIDDVSDFRSLGIDPLKIVETGLTAFLQMVFKDGLYHGDLHSGNLLVLPDGRVAMIDFGLCVHLSTSVREHLAGMLSSLVQEDFQTMTHHLTSLSHPSRNMDMDAFEQALSNEIAPFVGLKLAQVPTAKLMWKLARISAEHGAPVPRPLILFFKTLASFEGIGYRLHPDVDVLGICQNFAHELVGQIYTTQYYEKRLKAVGRDLITLSQRLPLQLKNLLETLNQGEMQLHIKSSGFKELSDSLDRVFSRMAVSIIVASLVIGSSILVLAKVGREYYHMSFFGIIGFSLAGVLGLYIIYSILRGGRRRKIF